MPNTRQLRFLYREKFSISPNRGKMPGEMQNFTYGGQVAAYMQRNNGFEGEVRALDKIYGILRRRKRGNKAA